VDTGIIDVDGKRALDRLSCSLDVTRLVDAAAARDSVNEFERVELERQRVSVWAEAIISKASLLKARDAES
jgi:hypothetical protein